MTPLTAEQETIERYYRALEDIRDYPLGQAGLKDSQIWADMLETARAALAGERDSEPVSSATNRITCQLCYGQNGAHQVGCVEYVAPLASNQYVDRLLEELDWAAAHAKADEREKGYDRLCRDSAKLIREMRGGHETTDQLRALVQEVYDLPKNPSTFREWDIRAARVLGLQEKTSRDDPNAAVRWICPGCTTVNAIEDEVCCIGSCKTPRPASTRPARPMTAEERAAMDRAFDASVTDVSEPAND
jgi:hypothetical protein